MNLIEYSHERIRAVAGDVLHLSAENSNLSDRIEYLDKDTFYRYIDPTKKPRQGRFSGGGSGGEWNY